MTTSVSTDLFPTSYFPPVALMAAMVQSLERQRGERCLILECCETFPKQTHRNRTVIVTSNGTMSLCVPLLRPEGNHTTTSNIGICYAERWNINHWRAIQSAYNSSPYFLYYRDEIEKLLLERYDKLIQLNEAILRKLLRMLKYDCEIQYSGNYLKGSEIERDYRDLFSYKHPERLPHLLEYTQVFADRMAFNPNVGILDLLFNLGPESREYLLGIAVGMKG